MKRFHLLTSYIRVEDKKRQKEYDETLKNNLELTNLFYNIHIFKPIDYDIDTNDNPNIKLIPEIKRMQYNDYFNYANNIIPHGDIVVLCNSDITFDSSITLLNNIDMKQYFIALTRYCPHNGNRIINDKIELYHNANWSQDTWIWESPIKIKTGDFYLGYMQCDGRIAHEAEQAGYKVVNPCLEIKTYHNHSVRVDNRNETQGRRKMVPPTKLFR